MSKTKIGVIGGSGIYEIDGLQNPKWQQVESPWGAASDELLTGELDGVEMVFLPRHGRGHVHAPSDVPYRANIDALKRLGVTDVISVSACGSFRDAMAPGHFVIVDQFIDRSAPAPSSPAVAWVMSASPIPPARGYRRPALRRQGRRGSLCMRVPHIWQWKGRNFRPWLKAACIVKAGGRM